MDQPELFYESKFDVLRATVAALGGLKVVGASLFPEKPASEAGRYLADCLNPDRPANLPTEKEHLLLRMAREKGVHLAITWILRDLGYADPTPIEPADQQSELMRQFIRAVDTAQGFARLLEKNSPQVRAVR